MPTTLKYQIAYPAGNVAPNVPLVMQTQAESVEAALTATTSKPTAVTTTDALWSYKGLMHVSQADALNKLVTFGLTMGRVGTAFTITTTYINAIPGFIPVGARPTDVVNGWALMTNSADAPIGTVWWRIATNGDLSFRLDTGSTSFATGNKIHLASNWMTV